MKEKSNLIITWIFTIGVCILCFVYISKYQKAAIDLDTTKYELQMVQTDLINRNDTIALFRKDTEMFRKQIEKLNTTLDTLNDPSYNFISLGEYKLTAYCPCEICCEGYALNRPLDQNGKPIVYTATGTVATMGRTIGVNPKYIPYGSTVYIEGLGFFVAEDTGGGIGTNHIDVYMDNHKAALNSGLTYGNVWVLVENNLTTQN